VLGGDAGGAGGRQRCGGWSQQCLRGRDQEPMTVPSSNRSGAVTAARDACVLPLIPAMWLVGGDWGTTVGGRGSSLPTVCWIREGGERGHRLDSSPTVSLRSILSDHNLLTTARTHFILIPREVDPQRLVLSRRHRHDQVGSWQGRGGEPPTR
jgi:hypothetical protein